MTEYTKGLDGIQLHLVDNVDTAQEFLRWAAERRPYNAVSIDIETGEYPGHDTKDALSPWHGKIRLVQVGDGMQGWSIPWEGWSGVFLQFAMNYTGLVICHNIAFEGKWFELQSPWRIPWERAHDTMIMQQVINPLESAALKRLSSRLIDPKAAALQSNLDDAFHANGWTWGSIPINFQPYWAYGALDTILTTRVFDEFWSQVGPGQVYSIPYELEMQTRKIANRMELNGSRVDLDYTQRKLDQLTQYTDSVKKWIRGQYKGASITSNIQMVRVFEGLGADITETTPSGNKSLTKDQLKMFVRDGSTEIKTLAETMLAQRKADKLASSYFSNFLKDNVDGILHPQIKTLAARTGRMSITDPALQTLPSGDATVRHAFIPREEGFGIVSTDLDQVEFRVTASLSGDQTLIKLFNDADISGGDVFTDIMRQVYDDDSLVKEDPRRKLIKSTIYGKLYGAGVEKMALTSGVKPEQMRTVVDAFDSNYPGVKLFQKKIEDIGMRRLRSEGQGYVTTATGRRLPCDSTRVYTLTNYLVQSSAAEILKQNLIKMDQADLTDYMLLPIHDEVVLEIPKDQAADILPVIEECMTTTEGWPIKLSAGVDGPFDNWGMKYEH